MKIQDLLNKKVMLLDLQATTKEAAIDEMINSLVDNGVVTDFDVFKAGIMAREAQTSTGLMESLCHTVKMLRSKKQLYFLLNLIKVWITNHLMVNLQTSSL